MAFSGQRDKGFLFAKFIFICTEKQFWQDLVDKTFTVTSRKDAENALRCLIIIKLFRYAIRSSLVFMPGKYVRVPNKANLNSSSSSEIFIWILYFKIDKKATELTSYIKKRVKQNRAFKIAGLFSITNGSLDSWLTAFARKPISAFDRIPAEEHRLVPTIVSGPPFLSPRALTRLPRRAWYSGY